MLKIFNLSNKLLVFIIIGKAKITKEIDNESSYIKDINKIDTTRSQKNFQEFKIQDNDPGIGYDGFSQDPSIGGATPKGTEKDILENFDKQKHKQRPSKDQVNKRLNKAQDYKKKRDDVIGPQQFHIGDDKDADPTEGFESVDGDIKDKKQLRKEGRK